MQWRCRVGPVVDGQPQEVWIHLNCSAPSDLGFIPCPGSRGDFSWIFQPACSASGNQTRLTPPIISHFPTFIYIIFILFYYLNYIVRDRPFSDLHSGPQVFAARYDSLMISLSYLYNRRFAPPFLYAIYVPYYKRPFERPTPASNPAAVATETSPGTITTRWMQ